MSPIVFDDDVHGLALELVLLRLQFCDLTWFGVGVP